MQARLQALARQQTAIVQLGRRALTGVDPSVLIQESMLLIAKTLDLEYCGVWKLLPNHKSLILQFGYGWQRGLVGYAMTGTQSTSQLGHALFSCEPVIVEDLRVDVRFSGPPLLHNHRIVSGVSINLCSPEESLGVLGAYTTRSRIFTQEDLCFLQIISNMLTQAMERQRSEARLRVMERVIAASSNGIVITDATQADNPIVYVNPAFEVITGYTASDSLGRNSRFLQGGQRNQPDLQILRDAIQEHQECHIVLQNIRKDGKPFWNELSISPVFDQEGFLTHFVGIQTDITARKQTEEALRKSEEQFRLTFNLAPIGMALTTPEGQFLEVNQALCDTLGFSAAELKQRTIASLSVPDGEGIDHSMTQKLLSGEFSNYQIEKNYLSRDKGPVHFLLQVTLVQDNQGKPLHCITQFVDITERKRVEDRLVYDALHDALTGLPNRSLFTDRLRQAVARTRRNSEYQFAVLFLDLDRFKVVNDSLGHLLGDQMLIETARRLCACLRPGDTVARLGGDEFTILLDSIQSISDATQIADRISQLLAVPFNLEGHEVFTSASIGIALSASGYVNPDDLLRDADTAMYRAKERGKACYAVFDTTMYDQMVTLLQLETDLRWALTRLDTPPTQLQELQVHYQPIISLSTGTISGFESLIRWHHPQKGWIHPSEFIPLAEETGLIVPLGQWVLQQSCQKLYQLQQQLKSHAPRTVSVNLSAKQFVQPNLVGQVKKILEESQLAPDCLRLEITESAIMQNPGAAARSLRDLKDLGVQLSLDDFGTGYSSLAYLHRFPIDLVKIDRSFISQIDQDAEQLVIVRAIVSLAWNLGMEVVAEGVETAQQLAQLRLLQCEYGQGFFFSRPIPGQELATLLASAPIW
ncbi:MAG: EAL domain-containing protein [Leptolyngbyaceae cyanobacterium bins.59]|nr:EAL domain-containing protein [Leptolyngbyaceae cyanobacterium bins.59]